MATGGKREHTVPKKVRRTTKANSLAHLSGCSSVALRMVVGVVGSYILYDLLVCLTSTAPISALR
jgi:hypothetical protein